MSSSNWCSLSCIHVSQEADNVVWYLHLIKNIPQFVVIHTVKGFGIVIEAEVNVFWGNSLVFPMIQRMLPIWSLVPLPFLNPVCSFGSSQFTYCWSLSLINWFISNCVFKIYKVQEFWRYQFWAYSRLRRRNMFEARCRFWQSGLYLNCSPAEYQQPLLLRICVKPFF